MYAQKSQISMSDRLTLVCMDFQWFEASTQYQLVWASHILEHQTNVGSFLHKLIHHCAVGGYITVPDPHRRLCGGHLTSWSPGLLAYNLVLCGIDMSDAVFIRGSDECSVIFSPLKIDLPSDLTFDYGDLGKLSDFLPAFMTEGSDSWASNFFKN